MTRQMADDEVLRPGEQSGPEVVAFRWKAPGLFTGEMRWSSWVSANCAGMLAAIKARGYELQYQYAGDESDRQAIQWRGKTFNYWGAK